MSMPDSVDKLCDRIGPWSATAGPIRGDLGRTPLVRHVERDWIDGRAFDQPTWRPA